MSPRLARLASSGRERGHDRDREQAVRELEERERGEVDRRVAAVAVGEEQRDPERDLVRRDVADGPAGEPGELADGRVAPLPDPVEPGSGVAQRRAAAPAPSRRSRRSSRARGAATSAGSSSTLVTVGRLARDPRQREQHRDHDDVVQHRRERGRREPAPRVEHRGGERGERRRRRSAA